MSTVVDLMAASDDEGDEIEYVGNRFAAAAAPPKSFIASAAKKSASPRRADRITERNTEKNTKFSMSSGAPAPASSTR